MKDQENIQEMLDALQRAEDRELHFDGKAIGKAYKKAYKKDQGNQSAIKILSIVGALLSCLAFLGFIYLTGLYNSPGGLLFLGASCVAIALVINVTFKKIILDTISVFFFFIGLMLLWFGFESLHIETNLECLLFIAISLLTLRLTTNYVHSFLSVLVINGSILALIISNFSDEWVHAYAALLTLAVCWVFLKEATIISLGKAWKKRYLPVRIGLVFSLLSVLALMGTRYWISLSPHSAWLSSVVFIAAIVYLAYGLLDLLDIREKKYRILICACCALLLLPTALSPAIPGTLLLILLSFRVNYKTSLAVGIVAFVYFVSKYYYDLHFTLLTKSMLLLASGILFLLVYLLTHKKLKTDEKV